MDNLHTSTFQFDSENYTQDRQGSSRRSGNLIVANHRIVSSDVETSESETSSTAKGKMRTSAHPLKCSTPFTSKTPTLGSCLIWEAVQAYSFSGTTWTIICTSWKDSTKQKYATYIRSGNFPVLRGTAIP